MIRSSALIRLEFVETMAAYNAWQNRSLVGAADSLEPGERTLNRGAFFDSILGTFSHLYWGDAMWMHRFHGTPKPPGSVADSGTLIADWPRFKAKRAALDEVIAEWADGVDEAWLQDVAGSIGASRTNGCLVTHFFNHQTHHRGQIHAMLTAAGAHPEPTDLLVMAAPEREQK
jgi:uncharacterized damage-inducible protein DinB